MMGHQSVKLFKVPNVLSEDINVHTSLSVMAQVTPTRITIV